MDTTICHGNSTQISTGDESIVDDYCNGYGRHRNEDDGDADDDNDDRNDDNGLGDDHIA